MCRWTGLNRCCKIVCAEAPVLCAGTKCSQEDFIQVQNHSCYALAPSSSGPGRQVLILKIAGSTPAGVTISISTSVVLTEVFCILMLLLSAKESLGPNPAG